MGNHPRKNQLKLRIHTPFGCIRLVSIPCVGCVAPSIGSADRWVTANPKPKAAPGAVWQGNAVGSLDIVETTAKAPSGATPKHWYVPLGPPRGPEVEPSLPTGGSAQGGFIQTL